MTIRGPRYSHEEFARRGQEIYDRVVRPALKSGDDNKLVAIDVDSAAFEIDEKDHRATARLRSRYPDAQIWLMRVGQPTAYRLGLGRAIEHHA